MDSDLNNDNNSSLFSQVFPQCDSQHNSLALCTSRCSKGKKERIKKWRRCRSQRSRELRWRLHQKSQQGDFSYQTTPHDTGIQRSVVLYCGNAKTPQSQNAELPMQVREPRMDDNCASAADNLRKISPSCLGSEKYSSLLSRSENTIFVSFTEFSQRKLLIYIL